eukprot:SAG11_NODE_4071_length_2079_cov_2.516667_1_plen_154_part_00
MVLLVQRVRGIYLRHSECIRDRQGVGTVLLRDGVPATDCARHCANETEGGLAMYPDDHYDKCVRKIMGLTAPRALVVLEKIVSPLSVVTTRHFRRLYEAKPAAPRRHYARTIVRAAMVLTRRLVQSVPEPRTGLKLYPTAPHTSPLSFLNLVT